jgi:hypothetical protein
MELLLLVRGSFFPTPLPSVASIWMNGVSCGYDVVTGPAPFNGIGLGKMRSDARRMRDTTIACVRGVAIHATEG